MASPLPIAVSSSLPIPILILILILTLILSAVSSAFFFPFANADASLDVTSLLAFKSAVTQDPLSVLQDWQRNTSPDACNWTGITCSTRHPARVVGIHLSNITLAGYISPHIANLSFLQVLDLSSNAFYGCIPSSLARLHRLHTLHLGKNSLIGAIPPPLGNLSSLRFLNLSNNNLKGGIPSSLGLLSNLEKLCLYENTYLGGPIPPSLGNLKKLKKFISFNNAYTGRIPLALCNCSLLLALDASQNELRGTIPECLGSLSRLYVLSLFENALHGEIPHSIWNLTALQALQLSHNNLRGALPASIGKLERLQYLVLGFNNIVGRIPGHLANCTQLIWLELMSNQLSGELPMWLGRLSRLQFLLLYTNKFTGKIRQSLMNCTELQILHLADNQLTGTIPSFIGQLSQLSQLDLGSNYLVSGLPTSKQPIPVLKTLYNCSYLTLLELGGNFLYGALPWDIGMHWPLMSYLFLDYSNISGRIPKSIGNFSSLLELDLEGNLLSGNIPHSWGNMKSIQLLSLSQNTLSGGIPWQITFLNGSLTYLYLYNNKLSGPLPPFIGNLVNLEQLDLRGNSFYGRIPPQLGKCKKLSHLILALNKFSGTIPPEVVDLKHIQTWFDLSRNSLKGDVPAEIEGLNMAEHIDLSQNQLKGNIGLQLDQWLNAQYVNLSFNNFSGDLPELIVKNLMQLQFLDVSHNNFTGLIPKSLFNLSQLKLNVSYNNFQGRLPCLSDFANDSKFSFAHNLQLCGDCFDLPKCKMHKHQRFFPHLLILKICIPIGVALILSLWILLLILKRKFKTTSTPMEMRRQFLWVSFEQIQAATQNFSATNLIGQGRHGLVYKGTLQEGQEVAIKVFSISGSATSDSTTFTRECETLGQVRHRNLIKIITACSTIHFKALILPFMPSSLHKILHEENTNIESSGTLFNLQIRLRILQDLAAALSYLHHDCSPCIIHCDVKPQNVLLDEEMTVHLSDFGIARLLCEEFSSTSLSTSITIDSPGYIAPEYGITRTVSTKGDVYSFGIVVLEVLTGLMPTNSMFEGDLTLPKWTSMAFLQTSEKREERIENVKRVFGKGRRGVERNIEKEEEWRAVEDLVKVAMMCKYERAEQRPSMRDVQGMLYSISSNLYENQSEHESENENDGMFFARKRRKCERFEIFLQRIEHAEREEKLKKKNEMHQGSSSSSY